MEHLRWVSVAPSKQARASELLNHKQRVQMVSLHNRLAVKVHRRVSLVYTDDALLAEELLARKKLAEDILGRLTPQVLLIKPGRVEAVIDELRKMNHSPRIM
jgi:hypothetical protein